MADKTLEERLTNGGRVPMPTGVSLTKLKAADQIIQGISRGDNLAIAEFKNHMGARFGESLTTGDDFIFSFTQLTALEVDNLFEAAERTWSQAIGTRTIASFDAPKVFSIDRDAVEGFARPQTEPGKPSYVPPVIPEGSPYPKFNFKGELTSGGGIHKAGGRFGLTFERIVSDAGEIVPQLPSIITEFLLDREEYDAWAGLVAFIDTPENHLKAATTLDGQTVVADAPISRASLAAALTQARLAEVNGRKVRVSGYNLVVPTGTRETAEWYLNTLALSGLEQVDGNQIRQFSLNGFNPLAGIRGVVETDYLTDSQWALIPVVGGTGNQRFYDLGRLRGHEAPEVRVQNLTGNYVGGGAVSPFEGSFDTDEAEMRGRVICGGLAWNSEFAVISDGDGA